MPRTIVFDVNETLLDMQVLAPVFAEVFGEAGALKEWFSLVLMQSQTSALAGPYFDFAQLGGAVLEMMGAVRQRPVSAADQRRVLDGLLRLPAHPEVKEALQVLREAGLRLVTLSNSSQQAVDQQVANAGLSEYFERNFSVSSVERFKPAPEAYRYVASELGGTTAELRMVAAHAWDVLGAMRAGCAAAFVARSGKTLFPLVAPPDIVGADLQAVARQIVERETAA